MATRPFSELIERPPTSPELGKNGKVVVGSIPKSAANAETYGSPTASDNEKMIDVQRTQENQASLINRLRVAGQEHDQDKFNVMLGEDNGFLNPSKQGGRKRKSKKSKRKTRKGGRRGTRGRKTRYTRRR
jgi:hypothetical protein